MYAQSEFWWWNRSPLLDPYNFVLFSQCELGVAWEVLNYVWVCSLCLASTTATFLKSFHSSWELSYESRVLFNNIHYTLSSVRKGLGDDGNASVILLWGPDMYNLLQGSVGIMNLWSEALEAWRCISFCIWNTLNSSAWFSADVLSIHSILQFIPIAWLSHILPCTSSTSFFTCNGDVPILCFLPHLHWFCVTAMMRVMFRALCFLVAAPSCPLVALPNELVAVADAFWAWLIPFCFFSPIPTFTFTHSGMITQQQIPTSSTASLEVHTCKIHTVLGIEYDNQAFDWAKWDLVVSSFTYQSKAHTQSC